MSVRFRLINTWEVDSPKILANTHHRGVDYVAVPGKNFVNVGVRTRTLPVTIQHLQHIALPDVDATIVAVNLFRFGPTPVLAICTPQKTLFYTLKAGFFVRSHAVHTLPGQTVVGLHPVVFESRGSGVVYIRAVVKDGTNSVSLEFWQLRIVGPGQLTSVWQAMELRCPSGTGWSLLLM